MKGLEYELSMPIEEYNALMEKNSRRTRTRVTIKNDAGITSKVFPGIGGVMNFEKSSQMVLHNGTVLGGRISALEDVLRPKSINPNHHTQTLNQQLGIQIDKCAELGLDRNHWLNRPLGYYCVGVNGLSIANPLQVIKSRNYETRLYGIRPLRCVLVDDDLSDEEIAQYRCRKKMTVNGKECFGYYLKTFDPGEIILLEGDTEYIPSYDDSNPVEPDSTGDSHSLADSSVIVYNKFDIVIGGVDFKEYYRMNNKDGSLDGANITELGICKGADFQATSPDDGRVYTEVANAELFGKLTFSHVWMNRADNSCALTYEIFS